jgi:hypothetical protein
MMNSTTIVALVCYGLASLLSMVFGSIYLLRSQFLPYHQEALGKSWQELGQNLQALLLGLMRAAGGGLLGGGISIAILLLIPFRGGETWSLYAIPAIGLTTALPALYATTHIRARTQANTPVAASAIGVLLLGIGFILSLI